MRIFKQPSKAIWPQILARPTLAWPELTKNVQTILQAVAKKGDAALLEYTEKFDGVRLENLAVRPAEISVAASQLTDELKKAIRQASANIEKFHRLQIPQDIKAEIMNGVRCWQKAVPIEKVGLYIPGGSAPLFSTILMLGIPAKVANCEEVILCTPPNKNGQIHPAILYTAQLLGITKIFKVGGAQAIGAMAYGTETIPNVDKIFGPGNQYVTAAKQLVSQQGTAIDLPAGPSEVLVFADEGAAPDFVAADLLSQAEHGEDSQVVLIVEKESLITPIQAAIKKQLAELPRRSIANKVINNSPCIISNSRQDSIDLINTYAPEHLILCCADPNDLAEKIKNAGSVFLGYYTPESAGDYASGTNHTLPTNGYAKAYSGVNMDAFYKKITYQEITPNGLKNIGPTIEVMAQAENLVAHKKAVSIRLKQLAIDKNSFPQKNAPRKISDLVRPNIAQLKPYASARTEFTGEASSWLDANEVPYYQGYNRYPDPLQIDLKKAITKIYPAQPEQLFLGNGSDEAIDLLIRIFCRPEKDRIITLPPTYGMYKVAAAINNIEEVQVPLLDNFQLDIPALINRNDPNDKILFICSPNNPTGNLINPADIEKVLHTFSGIVVIDQAYIDFSPADSWLNRLNDYPNLVILQTFSKAWGMAGIRLGMAFANASIIQLMNKIKAPYNISSIAQEYLLQKLNQKELLTNNQAILSSNKYKLQTELNKLAVVKKIYPSAANFLLCQVEAPRAIYQYLLAKGIVVRDRSQVLGCTDCLRITVGSNWENENLIKALKAY